MMRLVSLAVPLALAVASPLHAQEAAALNDVKADIWEAELAQRNFGLGLRHCNELNGSNFNFQPGDRVLNLEDYHRSLDNLTSEGVFNPETKRPWTKEDADAHWAKVQKQATTDQANCALVARLPLLEKKLKELQQQQSTPANASK